MDNLTKLLTPFLIDNGFKKITNNISSNFFRIYGQEICQVIEIRYEPVLAGHVLCIDAFSLYSSLVRKDNYLPARYCIMNLCGCGETYTLYHNYIGKRIPDSVQAEVLSTIGLEWFNTIRTPALVLDAKLTLDRIKYGSTYWLDYSKVAPALLSKRYPIAQRVISEILLQHASTRWENPCKGDIMPKELSENLRRQDEEQLAECINKASPVSWNYDRHKTDLKNDDEVLFELLCAINQENLPYLKEYMLFAHRNNMRWLTKTKTRHKTEDGSLLDGPHPQ